VTTQLHLINNNNNNYYYNYNLQFQLRPSRNNIHDTFPTGTVQDTTQAGTSNGSLRIRQRNFSFVNGVKCLETLCDSMYIDKKSPCSLQLVTVPQYATKPALFKGRERLEIGLRNENLVADILRAHYISLNRKGGLLDVTNVSRGLDHQFHILITLFTSGNSLFGGYFVHFTTLLYPKLVAGCGRPITYGNRYSSVGIGRLPAGTRDLSRLQRFRTSYVSHLGSCPM